MQEGSCGTQCRLRGCVKEDGERPLGFLAEANDPDLSTQHDIWHRRVNHSFKPRTACEYNFNLLHELNSLFW